MNLEFNEFDIHQKLRKREIHWNHNQVIWNYNQRDILFLKSAIFWIENWGKWRTLRTNLQNSTSKSNKNSNYLLIIDRISLLTWFLWDLGFNLFRLKGTCSEWWRTTPVATKAWHYGAGGADFHYTKWGLPLATTDFIGLARAWSYCSIFPLFRTFVARMCLSGPLHIFFSLF